MGSQKFITGNKKKIFKYKHMIQSSKEVRIFDYVMVPFEKLERNQLYNDRRSKKKSLKNLDINDDKCNLSNRYQNISPKLNEINFKFLDREATLELYTKARVAYSFANRS